MLVEESVNGRWQPTIVLAVVRKKVQDPLGDAYLIYGVRQVLQLKYPHDTSGVLNQRAVRDSSEPEWDVRQLDSHDRTGPLAQHRKASRIAPVRQRAAFPSDYSKWLTWTIRSPRPRVLLQVERYARDVLSRSSQCDRMHRWAGCIRIGAGKV